MSGQNSPTVKFSKSKSYKGASEKLLDSFSSDLLPGGELPQIQVEMARRSTTVTQSSKAPSEASDLEYPSDSSSGAASTLTNSKSGLERLLGRTQVGASPDNDQEVVIKHLINYLVIDMEKRTHMRKILPYLCFIVILTALALVSRLPKGSYSDALKQTEELYNVQQIDELKSVHNAGEMWSWINDTVSKIYAIAPAQYNVTEGADSPAFFSDNTPQDFFTANRDNIEANETFTPGQCDPEKKGSITLPVGLVVLRQWRVKEVTCGSVSARPSQVLTAQDRAGMPCICSHKYSRDEISREAYGNNGMRFETDRTKGYPLHSLGVESAHITYSDTGNQFSLIFALNEKPAEVAQRLQDIQAAGWADESTRLVSLETLWYNPDSEQFVRSACYIEFYQTGLPEGNCQIHSPFDIEVFGDDKAATVLSLIVYIYLLPFIAWFVDTVRFRVNVKKNFNIFSETFQLVHIGSLIWMGYLRGMMWQRSSAMTSGFFYEDYLKAGNYGFDSEMEGAEAAHLMFDHLSEYSFQWTQYNEVFGVVMILSWLRVFKYLQHVQTLNMLSETTKHAASGVLRLAIIFVYCVAAFSIAGSIVFGEELREFETPTHAASTLLRMFFMEHEPDYTGMKEKQPVWTPLYFVGFFVLCYFMLLNMVLAVIVSSFAQVQDLQENAQKQIEHREDQLCDMEIQAIRGQRRSRKFGAAEARVHPDTSERLESLRRTKGSSRSERFMERTKQAFYGVGHKVSEIVHHTNTQRNKAIELAKDHTARDLRVSRKILRQRPNYYNRVSITKEELKKVFQGHLSKEDVETIFLGVQKRAMQGENSHILLTQAIAELAVELRTKFADLDRKVETVKSRSNTTQLDVHGIAGFLSSQGGLGLLKQADDKIKTLEEALSKAKEEKRLAKQAAEAARRARQHDTLNQERDFLIKQLAAKEKDSIRADMGTGSAFAVPERGLGGGGGGGSAQTHAVYSPLQQQQPSPLAAPQHSLEVASHLKKRFQ